MNIEIISIYSRVKKHISYRVEKHTIEICFSLKLSLDFDLFIQNLHNEVIEKNSDVEFTDINDLIVYPDGSLLYCKTVVLGFPIEDDFSTTILSHNFQNFITDLWKFLEEVKGFFDAFVVMIKNMRKTYNSSLTLNEENAIIIYECQNHVLSKYFADLALLLEAENL